METPMNLLSNIESLVNMSNSYYRHLIRNLKSAIASKCDF